MFHCHYSHYSDLLTSVELTTHNLLTCLPYAIQRLSSLIRQRTIMESTLQMRSVNVYSLQMKYLHVSDYMYEAVNIMHMLLLL